MKILHVGLLSHFTDGMTYQENILSDIHCRDGNTVLFVSDNYIYQHGKLIEVPENEITLDNSLRLKYVKYDHILNKFITSKIQRVKKLKKIISDFKPDRILYHGVCGRELITVANYKKEHPEIKLYVDCHEDFHNTARTVVAKLAYKYIHGYFVKRALPYIDKILYITQESKEYLQDMYKIKDTMLEWYPLGGLLFDDKAYEQKRKERRADLKIEEKEVLFLHSGKMDVQKKTIEIVKAFIKVKDPTFKLIIIGSFSDDVRNEVEPYINTDKRIAFLGWKNGDELLNYLCAADVYLQPGSQSATMQNAICCRCAVVLYPYSSHKVFVNGNGFFVKNCEDIVNVFKTIQNNPGMISEMKKNSEDIARRILDYRKLAARIYV